MKVSVCITAYNHDKFISTAIESVLMQITDFDFEIIIGEDDSDDKTREIVKQYKNKYPDKIRLFLNDRSNVVYIEGKPTGRWNFINNITNANGEYIALLDGDDYWTSPHKLQKQIDFLDNNKDYNLCFHKVSVLSNKTNKTIDIKRNFKSNTFSINDLIIRDNFIHTCSVIFRNPYWKVFPKWFYQVAMADYPLFILLSQNGKIYHMNDYMGVYRIHENGLWNSKPKYLQVLTSLKSFKTICKNVDITKTKAYQLGLNNRYRVIIKHFRINEDLTLRHLINYTLGSSKGETFSHKTIELGFLIKHLFSSYFPNISKRITRPIISKANNT